MQIQAPVARWVRMWNICPAALWRALNLVMLLWIYLTSCLWQWEQKRSALPVQVLHPLHLLPLIFQGIRYVHQPGISLFVPVTCRWRRAAYSSSQIRGLENMTAVITDKWTKCAVESVTGCPKSLQVRDPKCFSMVYSKQLIKKKLWNYVLVHCFSYFLFFQVDCK